jgi:hypothetical protein
MDSPYQPGALLQLRLPQAGSPLPVLIRHVFKPSTMSVVLRISFENEPPTSIGKKEDAVILKLYDRRFAEDLRRNHRAASYTAALEPSICRISSSSRQAVRDYLNLPKTSLQAGFAATLVTVGRQAHKSQTAGNTMKPVHIITAQNIDVELIALVIPEMSPSEILLWKTLEMKEIMMTGRRSWTTISHRKEKSTTTRKPKKERKKNKRRRRGGRGGIRRIRMRRRTVRHTSRESATPTMALPVPR